MGYDLSDFPAFKAGAGNLRAFHMKDGDIWFVISYMFDFKDPMKGSLGGFKLSEKVLIKFFKQEMKKLNENELDKTYDQISHELGVSISKPAEEIKFKDGSILKRIRNFVPQRCTTPDYINNYLLKIDSKGNKKNILY